MKETKLENISKDSIFRRKWCALASYQDRYIIIAGGKVDQNSCLTSAFIFDTHSNTYKAFPDLPDEDYYDRGFGSHCVKYEFCSGAVLNDYFYLVARDYRMYRIRIIVEKEGSDVTGKMMKNEWETIENTDFLSKRMSSIVSDNKRLFLFCGGYLCSFDPDTNEWTKLSPIRTHKSRMFYAITLCERKIFIIGGYVKKLTAISSMEVYDIDSMTWTDAPDLPVPLCDSSTCVLNRRWIVVTGGISLNRKASKSFHIFDTYTQQWNPHISRKGVILPMGRMRHRAVALGESKVFFIGGNNMFGDILCLDCMRRRQLEIQSWYFVKDFILLRQLVDNDRAFIQSQNKIDHHDKSILVQMLMTNLDSDTFRHILSFV